MSNFIVPNTFIPGTKAKAQEVNENFTSIQNELNTKATKTGDVTQPFFVAPAIEDNQATTKKQIEKIIEDTKSNLFSEIEKNDLCLFALYGNRLFRHEFKFFSRWKLSKFAWKYSRNFG